MNYNASNIYVAAKTLNRRTSVQTTSVSLTPDWEYQIENLRTYLILRTTRKYNASGDGCRLHGGTGQLTISYITEGHRVRAAKKAWPHPAWLVAFHSELHCQYLTGWRCTALLSWLQEPGWNKSSVTSPLPTVAKCKILKADCSCIVKRFSS